MYAATDSLQLIVGPRRSELTLEYDPRIERATAWFLDRTGGVTECRQSPLTTDDLSQIRDWCSAMLERHGGRA